MTYYTRSLARRWKHGSPNQQLSADQRIRWTEVYCVKEGKEVDAMLAPGQSDYHTNYPFPMTGGFYSTTYYQTYGGGPEGGYFLHRYIMYRDKNESDLILAAEVHRNWGESFTINQLSQRVKFYFKRRNGILYIGRNRPVEYRSSK